MKETIKEAGYEYVGKARSCHILKDIKTGKYELWACNKHHAGYGIKFKNTHLEFITGIEEGIK